LRICRTCSNRSRSHWPAPDRAPGSPAARRRATTSDDDVTYPEDDTPGSQIRIHEGSEAPQLEAAVSQTPGMVPARTRRGRLVDGARFAYVKATEGTSYTNPEFAQQYNSS